MLRSIVLSTAGLLTLAASTPQPPQAAPTAPLEVLASARATTLVLSLDTVATPGGTASYSVLGAAPGENVHFVRAFGTGSGPCPGVLGGGCLDLDPASVMLMGSAAADAAGIATLELFSARRGTLHRLCVNNSPGHAGPDEFTAQLPFPQPG